MRPSDGEWAMLLDEGAFARFASKVAHSDGCWIWTAARSRGGYGKFRLRNGPGRAHQMIASRASFRFYKGTIPEGGIILHSCDNPACVNPDHLRVGDYVENQHDAVARGRHARLSGERVGTSKLSPAQVAEMRARSTGAYGEQAAFAQEYGVCQQLVSRILRGTLWNKPLSMVPQEVA